MAYGDPPGSFPWLPQVLATPAGWVRLDGAGKPVSEMFKAAVRNQWEQPPSQWEKVFCAGAVCCSNLAESEADPADDIMSAVRAVARSS